MFLPTPTELLRPLGPFPERLARHGLTLTRRETDTLQINVGFLCNLACKHCHLEAGPDRQEMMDSQTVEAVVSFACRGHFKIIDITGGAPELNIHLVDMIEKLSPFVPRLMLRSNLVTLTDPKRDYLMEVFKEHKVVILASLPSLDMARVESQRGKGIFEKSIAALIKLNSLGYGQEGSGLELNLVSNPTGPFLPDGQDEEEKNFRLDLRRKWGIVFNNLFPLANVPLGRFRQWLSQSNNLENYLQMLAAHFNLHTVEGLMCQTLVSVSWDGYLYDCDFNLAQGLFMGRRKTHVSEMDGAPPPGSPVATSDHCYACVAKSGFT